MGLTVPQFLQDLLKSDGSFEGTESNNIMGAGYFRYPTSDGKIVIDAILTVEQLVQLAEYLNAKT